MAMTGREAAARLARRTGLPVAPADVRELAARGFVRVVVPGDWPLYEIVRVTRRRLRHVVAERIAWIADSIDRWDAADALGLSQDEFREAVARHGLRPGRFNRYRRADVARLGMPVTNFNGFAAPSASMAHESRREHARSDRTLPRPVRSETRRRS